MANIENVLAQTVDQLRSQLRLLEQETERVKRALAALTPMVDRHNAARNQIVPQRRVYSYGVTSTCARCGKEFKSARQLAPGKPRYCHNPCTAWQAAKELERATRPEPKPPEPPPAPVVKTHGKPVAHTLLQGARK